jgi:hypothetical protein
MLNPNSAAAGIKFNIDTAKDAMAVSSPVKMDVLRTRLCIHSVERINPIAGIA